jgi:hypothetical protein
MKWCDNEEKNASVLCKRTCKSNFSKAIEIRETMLENRKRILLVPERARGRQQSIAAREEKFVYS